MHSFLSQGFGEVDFFLVFITPLITTLLLVPPVKKLAFAAGAIDEPNERKVHEGRIPRIGGLAMFFGFILTYLMYFKDFNEYRGIFVGMVIIVIVGIIDDSMNLEPRLKLLGQIVAAIAAMTLSNVNIDLLGGALGSNFNLGYLSAPLTVVWIVGITNAINLSDGLDGLASGISLIAFSSFGFLAYYHGDYTIFSLCLVLIGCILGFLRYNTHPAEIFMGDTGSLFLGYCLGTLSITGNFKSITTMTLIAPVLVLLVPICDTLWAIMRRLWAGRSPFSADKKHFHHKLMEYGMDHSQTVSVIYAISSALSVCAVALVISSHLKYLLVPTMILAVALTILQIFGRVDLFGWVDRYSKKLDHVMPFERRGVIMQTSLRLVYAGLALYGLLFLMELPFLSLNLLFVTLTVCTLVVVLTVTRGENGHNFLIFSLFFLAAVMMVVVRQSAYDYDILPGLNAPFIQGTAFVLLVSGVFGKLMFRKKKELLLTTPLEFFIFLTVISMALVPEELRVTYQLVPNMMQTFALFLGFKILALTSFENQARMVSPTAVIREA